MDMFRRWLPPILYTAGIIIVTPFLPDLIRGASSRWSSPGVSCFVLKVEIFLAAFVLAFSIFLFFFRKYKSFFPILSLSSIFLLSFLIYQYVPNPYEFTHLPEYAVLSVLLLKAVAGKKRKSFLTRSPYLLSVSITGAIGLIDEVYQHFLPNRYFTVYDVFLNVLGGIIGLLICWGIKSAINTNEPRCLTL